MYSYDLLSNRFVRQDVVVYDTMTTDTTDKATAISTAATGAVVFEILWKWFNTALDVDVVDIVADIC
ncbi:Hypothetical predicted protein [Octopus vulgaris]|uniref:Uncharacterized protein n=1 Tax=Octopus vulgaris TaxID=6645 RepID=A0AA36AH69_OCTVU|nr:Hypothetical predicted protein [Octopus vulgaris]